MLFTTATHLSEFQTLVVVVRVGRLLRLDDIFCARVNAVQFNVLRCDTKDNDPLIAGAL